jgi:hypothetical protein
VQAVWSPDVGLTRSLWFPLPRSSRGLDSSNIRLWRSKIWYFRTQFSLSEACFPFVIQIPQKAVL